MVFDKATKHDEDKAVSKNAGSKGGKISVKQKQKANLERDADILKDAENYKRSNLGHEIIGKLAKKYKLTPQRIGQILKKRK